MQSVMKFALQMNLSDVSENYGISLLQLWKYYNNRFDDKNKPIGMVQVMNLSLPYKEFGEIVKLSSMNLMILN